MPYVSRTELEFLLFQEILLLSSLFSVVPRNGPKLNVHAGKELDGEGEAQIGCALGGSNKEPAEPRGENHPWFVGLGRPWALVSLRVRLMGACDVTTVTEPRTISFSFFLSFIIFF